VLGHAEERWLWTKGRHEEISAEEFKAIRRLIEEAEGGDDGSR